MSFGIRIAAGDVTVGTELACADGYLFTVKEIVRRTPKTITLKLASDFSPMSCIRSGVEKTFRVSSILLRARTAQELEKERSSEWQAYRDAGACP